MLSTASGGLSTVCLLIFTSLHAKLCNGYLEISKRRTTQLRSLCFLSSPPLWGSGWASIGPCNPTCYSSWLFSSIHGGCAFSGLLTSFAFTVSLGLWSDIPSHVSANTSYSTYLSEHHLRAFSRITSQRSAFPPSSRSSECFCVF